MTRLTLDGVEWETDDFFILAALLNGTPPRVGTEDDQRRVARVMYEMGYVEMARTADERVYAELTPKGHALLKDVREAMFMYRNKKFQERIAR
jgi:hypothetical protein